MGGVEQDGGERGGHDTSVLQTLLLHRHKVWGGLLLPCLQRVVSVEVYVFWGVLKGTVTRLCFFFPSSITRCDGRDTGGGRWRKTDG